MAEMLGFARTRGEVGGWCTYWLMGRNRASLAKNTKKEKSNGCSLLCEFKKKFRFGVLSPCYVCTIQQ